MNFAFSEEQDEFRGLLRRFIEERWPIAETRRLSETETGFEPAVWKQMAEELGLQGLAIAEEHGGQGFGMLELGIALEELGRQLAGGPFFASACLATFALQNCATPSERAELLPGLASGDARATYGFGIDIREDGERLSGRLPWCIDPQNASLLLVSAGSGLYAVDPSDCEVERADAVDLTRRYGHVVLENTPARLLGGGADVRAGVQKTIHQAIVALSAEQVGAAAHCLDEAVAYVKQRLQFGRPVAGFQAVKHRAADAYASLELARSASYWAWWVVANDTDELAEAAHVVKSLCSAALRTCAHENIHLHGGYGFTWEHDAHLYYRRANANEILFGNPVRHRAQLASVLGVGPG
jgi:alkylation response protein AidB-like acyl-CoA dehydrogenase